MCAFIPLSATMGGGNGTPRNLGQGGRPQRRGASDPRALGASAHKCPSTGTSVPDCAGCAKGGNDTEVAETLSLHRKTVGKWRNRFLEQRLEGLHDEPRPGAPRTISDDDVEEVIVKTLEQTPADATHWSTRSMAKTTGMSQSAVSRIWRAFGLKPHLTETFTLSPDPLFVDKVRDIVGLYVNPPQGALVLCVDEKSQIQALDRTSPVLALRPGLPERRTHDLHDRSLCGARRCVRTRHRRHDRSPPRRRVPALLEPHQSQCARRA